MAEEGLYLNEQEPSQEEIIRDMALNYVESFQDSISGILGRPMDTVDLGKFLTLWEVFGAKVAEEFEARGWNDGFIEGSSKQKMRVEELRAQARGEE